MIAQVVLVLLGVSAASVAADLIKYGNVSYQNIVVYELASPRNVQLRLVSESGDADLYVFSWKRQIDKSTINFSDYHFKADSFGVDSIAIGKEIDFPVSVVVFGVAQEDSRYALQISSAGPVELDYPAIDAAVQRGPGASYEELCLQHSFDSDAHYAHEEQARQRLLSLDTYPLPASTSHRERPTSAAGGGARDSPSEGARAGSRQRQSRERRRSAGGSGSILGGHGDGSGQEGDSFLYHFLLWLLEFIVDVFF